MAKNINKRFFSEFLIILSKRVNPHPDEECDETPFFHKCPVPGSKVLFFITPYVAMYPICRNMIKSFFTCSTKTV